MSEQEIFSRVKEIGPELLKLLAERKPELVELYQRRLVIALGPYSPEMRIHNAHEILRAYAALKEAESA